VELLKTVTNFDSYRQNHSLIDILMETIDFISTESHKHICVAVLLKDEFFPIILSEFNFQGGVCDCCKSSLNKYTRDDISQMSIFGFIIHAKEEYYE
jgi:hypothetical protein